MHEAPSAQHALTGADGSQGTTGAPLEAKPRVMPSGKKQAVPLLTMVARRERKVLIEKDRQCGREQEKRRRRGTCDLNKTRAMWLF